MAEDTDHSSETDALVVPSTIVIQKKRRLNLAALATACASACLWFFPHYLQTRGSFGMNIPRLFLILTWLSGMSAIWLFVVAHIARSRATWIIVSGMAFTTILGGLEFSALRQTTADIVVDPTRLAFDASMPLETFSVNARNKTDSDAYSVQIKLKFSQKTNGEFSFEIPHPQPIIEGSRLADIQGLRCQDANKRPVVMFWIYRIEPGGAREIVISHNLNSPVTIDSTVVYFSRQPVPRAGDRIHSTGTFHFDEPLVCNGDITFEAKPPLPTPTPAPPSPAPKKFPYPGYISRLDLDAATIGETLDSPKYTAVELRHRNGSSNPLISIVNQGALVFHTEALRDSDIAAYQDRVLAEVMKAPLHTIAGLGPANYGLIHVPNVPGSGSERLARERLNILNAEMFLYVFVAYKYRDTEMPKNMVGVTEWCVCFNGPITVTTTPGRNISTLKKVDTQ